MNNFWVFLIITFSMFSEKVFRFWVALLLLAIAIKIEAIRF